MTNKEKRQELDKFCREQHSCGGCVLGDDVCRCGNGYYFTISKGEEGYMTRAEIDKAFDVAYPGTKITDARFNEDGHSPVIKDSGERRQFYDEDGNLMAVRDIQEGKGRCDLMPLDVVAEVGCCWDQWHRDILLLIRQFQVDGHPSHLYTTIRLFGSNVYADPQTMLLETAKHFEAGAKKYGEYNWQKGIPVKSYIDSAIRHYLKCLRGDNDEPHDRAFCWNILCAIWTCKHKPELNDYKENDNECNLDSSNT